MPSSLGIESSFTLICWKRKLRSLGNQCLTPRCSEFHPDGISRTYVHTHTRYSDDQLPVCWVSAYNCSPAAPQLPQLSLSPVVAIPAASSAAACCPCCRPYVPAVLMFLPLLLPVYLLLLPPAIALPLHLLMLLLSSTVDLSSFIFWFQIMTSSDHDSIKSWHHQIMAASDHDIIRSWQHQIMTSSDHDSIRSWHHHIMTSVDHDIIRSWHHQIMTSSDHVIMCHKILNHKVEVDMHAPRKATQTRRHNMKLSKQPWRRIRIIGPTSLSDRVVTKWNGLKQDTTVTTRWSQQTISNPSRKLTTERSERSSTTSIQLTTGQWLCGWAIWNRDRPRDRRLLVRFQSPPTFWLIALNMLLTLCPCSPNTVNRYRRASELGVRHYEHVHVLSHSLTQESISWPERCNYEICFFQIAGA